MPLLELRNSLRAKGYPYLPVPLNRAVLALMRVVDGQGLCPAMRQLAWGSYSSIGRIMSPSSPAYRRGVAVSTSQSWPYAAKTAEAASTRPMISSVGPADW
ncbi:hypothetical protein Val02_66220 [Virgisporangium aliadipatigenens]|uniref:Uncharacterized protein n=1 Tax=Virgisporangium aliadipatigenens TaxID=741659 RepID=A0A8J4DTW7_9ACTN|nr:hypothetical protein Val02_66220 [Virgisporangium aliadipatigenens]